MKVAVVGSRSFTDFQRFASKFSLVLQKLPCSEIISGGARGTDSLAKKFCMDNGIRCNELIPDWRRYGRTAGLKRNEQIVGMSDFIVAFWDGRSRGTSHTISLAIQKCKPYIIVNI